MKHLKQSAQCAEIHNNWSLETCVTVSGLCEARWLREGYFGFSVRCGRVLTSQRGRWEKENKGVERGWKGGHEGVRSA